MIKEKIKNNFKNLKYVGNKQIKKFLTKNLDINLYCEDILAKYPRFISKENIVYFILKDLYLDKCKCCRKRLNYSTNKIKKRILFKKMCKNWNFG